MNQHGPHTCFPLNRGAAGLFISGTADDCFLLLTLLKSDFKLKIENARCLPRLGCSASSTARWTIAAVRIIKRRVLKHKLLSWFFTGLRRQCEEGSLSPAERHFSDVTELKWEWLPPPAPTWPIGSSFKKGRKRIFKKTRSDHEPALFG